MRVKHKDAEKNNTNPSMPLSSWHKEYYPNKKYLNYEFYNVKDIYDLYEIDENTGNLTYIRSDFAHSIFPICRENPKKFVYKEHDPKYLDEYLMPRKNNYGGVSFFKRIKAKIKQLLNPRKNPNRIPFSRFEKWSLFLMALAVIVPIGIYLVSEINK